MQPSDSTYLSEVNQLSLREQRVLQYIIQKFIISANPIASKELAEHSMLNVSPATIRNTMQSLEKKGFLSHIHTSSGRFPTDKGYRFYVNSLMNTAPLTHKEFVAIEHWKEEASKSLNDAILSATHLLSKLSHLLTIVIAPRYAESVFRKLELIDLSEKKILIVLTIETGLIKTVTVEVESSIRREELQTISRFLNERFSGLTLQEITNNIDEVVSGYPDHDHSGILRIFIDSAEDIFEDHKIRRFHFGGVEYMAMQPEFSDLHHYKSIIEFVENEDLIIHLFDQMNDSDSKVNVTIGTENNVQQIEKCSVVSANYMLGSTKGTIGLVGPTRMNYPRMVALVEQLAQRFQTIN